MSNQSFHKFDQVNLLRVLEVAKRLGEPLDLPAMLERVIDAGREVFSADRGAIFLYDTSSRELYSVVATGVEEIRFSVDVGIAGECAVQRKIVNVADCQNDGRFNSEIDKATGYVTRNLVAVPLVGTDDELVGVLELLNTEQEFDAQDEQLLAVLASQAAVAIQRTHLMEERLVRVKLERELDIARDIQQRLLPNQLPDCPGYQLAVFNEPADQTGGDLYDVVSLTDPFGDFQGVADADNANPPYPDAVMFVLADATGHGIGPALTVTLFRALLRMGLRSSQNLNTLVDQINQQLQQDLAVNRFITAFFGVLNLHRNELVYQAPGQAPLLHYHYAEDRCEFIDASTLPLGIMEQLPLEAPGVIAMQPGDVFVLLTDGFYERQNQVIEEFGIDRLAEQVRTGRDESADDLLKRLCASVDTFAQQTPPTDDLTAIILKRDL